MLAFPHFLFVLFVKFVEKSIYYHSQIDLYTLILYVR